jgi:hypothetical protein
MRCSGLADAKRCESSSRGEIITKSKPITTVDHIIIAKQRGFSVVKRESTSKATHGKRRRSWKFTPHEGRSRGIKCHQFSD